MWRFEPPWRISIHVDGRTYKLCKKGGGNASSPPIHFPAASLKAFKRNIIVALRHGTIGMVSRCFLPVNLEPIVIHPHRPCAAPFENMIVRIPFAKLSRAPCFVLFRSSLQNNTFADFLHVAFDHCFKQGNMSQHRGRWIV